MLELGIEAFRGLRPDLLKLWKGARLDLSLAAQLSIFCGKIGIVAPPRPTFLSLLDTFER